MLAKFLIPTFFIVASPVSAFATASHMFQKYFSGDQFSFDGRRFNGLSEQFAHSSYNHQDPDHKYLVNEEKDLKYRFDWRHEFAGNGKESERISRMTETTSTGTGDNRVVAVSTATFYNNNKLRARTVCQGDGTDQMHCVTATQKSCLGVLEKYKEVSKATKERSALLSQDPAENEKNIKTCQNLMQGYADVAGASHKYMKTADGYNDVVRSDSEAIQSQADLVFGKRKVIFSNINANPVKLGDVINLSKQAQASAQLLGSASGIELIHKLVQACRESQRDFDTSRLTNSGKPAASADGSR